MRKMTEQAENKVVLELKEVTYTYEGEVRPVWEHLCFRFLEGGLYAIGGPSGCGKSSILFLLNGLIPHMYEGKLEGKVYLEHEDITQIMPSRRCEKIGLVMQNPESQFCTFTVEEELAFGMENLGIGREEMKRRIRKVLGFLGMLEYETCDLNQLSGGQKQKIAIASILVMEPKIVLMDEPTANLDPKSRKEVFQIITRLAREENITVILVEHNIEEIREEVDGFLLLDGEGRVVAEEHQQSIGTPILENGHSNKEIILKISDVSFGYPIPGTKPGKEKNKKKILDGVNLEIRKQEFVALMGENGAGKTTLMQLIFQIYHQDQGQITLYDKPVERYRKKELYSQIGLVFQNPENQFITNTVLDEMMFSLKRVKCSKEEKEKRVYEMLKRFHLEKEIRKSPFVLSQGQKRRLSVASMLLTNQRVLFLDEPTYGQDFENRHKLMRDMQELIKQGITIVMITHDLSLVKQYATRVIEIGQGKVVTDEPAGRFFQVREGI